VLPRQLNPCSLLQTRVCRVPAYHVCALRF
jgi:hypothetical protein